MAPRTCQAPAGDVPAHAPLTARLCGRPATTSAPVEGVTFDLCATCAEELKENQMITAKTHNLTSADPTILLPDEIHLHDDGRAVACHAASGDVTYDSYEELCAAYQIDPAHTLIEGGVGAAVVAHLFDEAGLSGRDVPALSEEGELSDGNHWEQAALTLAGLREQCQRWIAAVRS